MCACIPACTCVRIATFVRVCTKTTRPHRALQTSTNAATPIFAGIWESAKTRPDITSASVQLATYIPASGVEVSGGQSIVRNRLLFNGNQSSVSPNKSMIDCIISS